MLIGRFRASYAHVFQPATPPGGGEAKYQITMLIPKSDVNSYNAIVAEINRVLQEGIQKTFGGQMPARPSIPLYDGDGAKQNGEPWGEECKGHWVLRASSKTRPSVVDVNIQPILDPNAFYSGCYARATVNFYAYSQNGNKGVGCGLNNVQKIADGEPLSGRTTAEEDFGGANAYSGTAPAPTGYGQPAYQPTAYQQPAYQAQAYQQPTGGFGGAPVSQPGMTPGYTAPLVGYAPPAGSAPQQPAFDPITGRPLPAGGVMGI